LAGAAGSAPGVVGGGSGAPGDGGGTAAQPARTNAIASATMARRAGICELAIIGVGGGSE
jgi:hypothetical protein